MRFFEIPTRNLVVLALLALGVAAGVQAQTPVRVEATKPDCDLFFTLTTASPNSGSFNNMTTGCSNWVLVYSSATYAALNVNFQEAPNNAGVPGVWGAFGGTILFGLNPMIDTNSDASTYQGYAPWLRVALTGVAGAGSVTGRLYGYRIIPGGPMWGTLTVAAIAGDTTVVGKAAHGAAKSGNPILIAGADPNNVETVLVDTSGRVIVAGGAAAGAAPAGNPVLVSGSDGAAVRSLLTDATGRLITVSGGGVVASAYTYRYDYDVGGNLIYEGYALSSPAPGTAAAVWAIKRYTWVANNLTAAEWADGNTSLDNIWDNRAALAYQ